MSQSLPPIPKEPIEPESQIWREWFNRLRNTLVGNIEGVVSWVSINFTGSDIKDIVARSHEDLQNLQGGAAGQHYHLTSAQYTALTPVYASYLDLNQQTAAANTPTVITLGTVDFNSGVSLVSSSQIKVASAGKYNYQFSAQFENTNAQLADVSIWIRKNGTDIVASNGLCSVPNSHGSVHGHAIVSWNYILDLAVNDYIQFVWSTSATTCYIKAYAASTTPAIPSTPSMIVTVSKVG